MDVTGSAQGPAAALLPEPRAAADDATQRTQDTCNQLIRHMKGWVCDMEIACEAGDLHRLLALSAAVGESNSYLAGVADKQVRC